VIRNGSQNPGRACVRAFELERRTADLAVRLLAQLERVARTPGEEQPRRLAEFADICMHRVTHVKLIESGPNYVIIRVGKDNSTPAAPCIQRNWRCAPSPMLRIQPLLPWFNLILSKN